MAYVTKATTSGGRNGRAMLDNGALGARDGGAEGSRRRRRRPQSRAVVRARLVVVFGQALMLIAKKHGLDGQAAKVTCEVTLNIMTAASRSQPN